MSRQTPDTVLHTEHDVCFLEPELWPRRDTGKVRPRLPGSAWHDVWPQSSWFSGRVSREQRHTGTQMTAFFLSVSQKPTPSLTSTLLHLEHKHSSAPPTHTHTPTVHHQPGLGYDWLHNIAVFYRRDGGMSTMATLIYLYIFFPFCLLLPSRSFWISVWQRKSQVAANTQHLGC